ncbi:glycogen synthase [Patescibacteria group bacterium]|nr:glycogen synthase [Patescibacteria group bacterium]
MKKIKVLLVASELTPFAKVGGLADVVGALPKALRQLGVDARIVMPKYGVIDEEKYELKKVVKEIKVPYKNKEEAIAIWKATLPGSSVPVYLIDHPEYLGENDIYYGDIGGNFAKETRRFTFFARSVLEIFGPLKWTPDIIHCHDWHASILIPLMKILHSKEKDYQDFPTLLTIHNLAFQGKYPPEKVFKNLGVTEDDWPTLKERFGKNNDINYLQQAILNSDNINTVSPTYAKEILTEEFGEGMEETLAKRRGDLYGILNGIDRDRFNPETDTQIKINFSLKTIEKKGENKLYLQKIVGLPENKDIPVIGMVSRLTDQKGLDLILEIIDELATLEVQMVFLGTGDKALEDKLEESTQKYPRKIAARIEFDAVLAQQIYAGADLFFMPSRFEPCGLGQMISMRYGTVPIVRATGGLKDSVVNYNPQSGTGTGFVFQNYESSELLAVTKKSLKMYEEKEFWKKLVASCLNQDFSWAQSAQKYIELYEKSLTSK